MGIATKNNGNRAKIATQECLCEGTVAENRTFRNLGLPAEDHPDDSKGFCFIISPSLLSFILIFVWKFHL